MSRIFRFDTAKTILMVQVVFDHAVVFGGGTLPLKELARFSILGCAMPLFLFISGFFSKPKPSIRSMFGLCILFVLCNTIGNLITTLSWGLPFNLFRRAEAMWYLVALLIYRGLMPMFARILTVLLVAGSFALSWSPAFLPTCFPPIVGQLLAHLPYFVLGYVVSSDSRLEDVKNWMTSSKSTYVGYAFVLATILATGAWFALKGIRPGFITRNVACVAFGGGFRTVIQRVFFQVLYIVMCISFLKLCPVHETPLSKFGSRTLPVYLFHLYLLIPVGTFVSHHPSLWPCFIRYSIMGFAAIVCIVFFHPHFQFKQDIEKPLAI